MGTTFREQRPSLVLLKMLQASFRERRRIARASKGRSQLHKRSWRATNRVFFLCEGVHLLGIRPGNYEALYTFAAVYSSCTGNEVVCFASAIRGSQRDTIPDHELSCRVLPCHVSVVRV